MNSSTEPSRWECLRQRLELPVFTKEMRARMHGNRMPILLFVCTVVPVIVGIIECFSLIDKNWNSANTGNALAEIGKGLFKILAYLEGGLIVLITPALTAGVVTTEKEQQSLEALWLTPMSSGKIILGKLLSALSVIVLIVLCALPVMAIAFIFGGVSPAQVGWSAAIILATAVLFGAIGLYCSVRFRKTATAVVAAYLISLGWLLVIPFLLSTISETYSGNDQSIGSTLVHAVAIILPLVIVTSIIKSIYQRLSRRQIPWPGIALIQFLLAACLIIVLTNPPDINGVYFVAATSCSLLYAIPVAALVALLLGLITRRAISINLQLALWGFLALSLMAFFRWFPNFIHSQITYSPGCCVGNPGFALLLLLDYRSSFRPPMDVCFVPITFAMLLIGAWMMVMLAVRLFDQQRKCCGG